MHQAYGRLIERCSVRFIRIAELDSGPVWISDAGHAIVMAEEAVLLQQRDGELFQASCTVNGIALRTNVRKISDCLVGLGSMISSVGATWHWFVRQISVKGFQSESYSQQDSDRIKRFGRQGMEGANYIYDPIFDDEVPQWQRARLYRESRRPRANY